MTTDLELGDTWSQLIGMCSRPATQPPKSQIMTTDLELGGNWSQLVGMCSKPATQLPKSQFPLFPHWKYKSAWPFPSIFLFNSYFSACLWICTASESFLCTYPRHFLTTLHANFCSPWCSSLQCALIAESLFVLCCPNRFLQIWHVSPQYLDLQIRHSTS